MSNTGMLQPSQGSRALLLERNPASAPDAGFTTLWQRQTITREQCLELNAWVRAMAESGTGDDAEALIKQEDAPRRKTA